MKSANSGLDISLACLLRTEGDAARAGDRSRADDVMGVLEGMSLQSNLPIKERVPTSFEPVANQLIKERASSKLT